jgi:hypothetical protein
MHKACTGRQKVCAVTGALFDGNRQLRLARFFQSQCALLFCTRAGKQARHCLRITVDLQFALGIAVPRFARDKECKAATSLGAIGDRQSISLGVARTWPAFGTGSKAPHSPAQNAPGTCAETVKTVLAIVAMNHRFICISIFVEFLLQV